MNIPHDRRSLRGFSLIEIMVGIVIGMIAVLVIYQVYAAAEGIKRNTTSVGDAQQNGLLSSFMLGVELANASHGVADSMRWLAYCNAKPTAATTLSPIPLVITAGASAATPDSFVVNYSLAQRRVTPAEVVGTDGTSYIVQSPIGFAKNDLIIAIPSSAGGDCVASKVSDDPAAVACPASDQIGCVKVSPAGGTAPAAFLLDMGPTKGGVQQRVQYDVDNVANVLRSTVLWNSNGLPVADAPNPIAPNVVNMKLQYGIDTNSDGVLDTWVSADTAPWRPADLLGGAGSALVAQLKTLKAVRIGIVVRGEQWDKDALDAPWSLFGGVYSGTFPRAGGNYRYRTYETVIPLRNEIWNGS